MQFRIRAEDQYKSLFRVPCGQYEFPVGPFCLYGMSVLMGYTHNNFGSPSLVFDSAGRALRHQWLQQQRHVSHHQARWLNLLAEYRYNVVHIPGLTSPADFLTRKRFPDGPGQALYTGYDDVDEPDSALELLLPQPQRQLQPSSTQDRTPSPPNSLMLTSHMLCTRLAGQPTKPSSVLMLASCRDRNDLRAA